MSDDNKPTDSSDNPPGMTQEEKKALIKNVVEIGRDYNPFSSGRRRGYDGPPTTNQGPRRRGQGVW